MKHRRPRCTWLKTAWIVLAGLTILAGCSGDRSDEDDNDRGDDRSSVSTPATDGFTGRFTGSFPIQGQAIPIRLDLQQNGETVTGDYHAVYPFAVDAKTTGPTSIAGTLSHPQLRYQFTGDLTDTGLKLVARPAQPIPGMPPEVTIDLTRQPATPPQANGPANTGDATLDPRLVGVWKSVATSGRRPLRPGTQTPRPTSEMVSELNTDGSFRFQTTSIQAHLPSNPTPTPVIAGQWKTENGTLFTQAAGNTQWVPLGPYQLDGLGTAMTITVNGSPQLWERVR